jgi:hypothetical protein
MGEVIPIRGAGPTCFSGGELPHGSTEVWALSVPRSWKAHFWLRHPNGYQRKCDGLVAPAFLNNGQSTLFSAGNFPKCKRCMNKLIKSH